MTLKFEFPHKHDIIVPLLQSRPDDYTRLRSENDRALEDYLSHLSSSSGAATGRTVTEVMPTVSLTGGYIEYYDTMGDSPLARPLTSPEYNAVAYPHRIFISESGGPASPLYTNRRATVTMHMTVTVVPTVNPDYTSWTPDFSGDITAGLDIPEIPESDFSEYSATHTITLAGSGGPFTIVLSKTFHIPDGTGVGRLEPQAFLYGSAEGPVAPGGTGLARVYDIEFDVSLDVTWRWTEL